MKGSEPLDPLGYGPLPNEVCGLDHLEGEPVIATDFGDSDWTTIHIAGEFPRFQSRSLDQIVGEAQRKLLERAKEDLRREMVERIAEPPAKLIRLDYEAGFVKLDLPSDTSNQDLL